MKRAYIFLACLIIGTCLQGQKLEVIGKVKISSMDTVNSADSVVVWLGDSTLAVRHSTTLKEYQVLTISNDTIYLTNGGFVKVGWALQQDNLKTTHRVDMQGDGMLPPRKTTEERNNINNVQLGLMIFNTSTNCLEIFIDEWVPLCSSHYVTRSVNKLIGGSNSDYDPSIVQTSDAGYIIGGSSVSSASGDVTGTNNGGVDYWIVKLSYGGGIEWNTLIGGSSNDNATSIAQTSDGGYIVGGSSVSSASGDVTGTNNGSSDYWIVKLNSVGGIEWDTLIGGSSIDNAQSIAQTSDGGYIVAGYSYSSSSGDVTGTNNGGSGDYWIVKLNSGGGIEWDTLIGGSSTDRAYSIVQTSDGGYIVGGYSSSSADGDVTGISNGNSDYWIVKLNSGGGIEWDTLIGGSGTDQAYSIAQTFDGGYIVGGHSFSSASGDVTGTNNGSSDYWIVKLNNGGGIEWDSLIGGSAGDYARSIAQTLDGSYIVGGYSSSSASGDVTDANNGGIDNWIVKLNSVGGIEWDSLLGGSADDEAYGIAQTSDGNFVAGGASFSSASGDVTGTSNGGSDYWIFTLDVFGMFK